MSQLILPRRGFLAGLGSLLLAPAVVKAESLMPVKSLDRFYIRGLVDYNIMDDKLYCRIDKANFALPIPKPNHVAGYIPYEECKRILNGFNPETLKQLELNGLDRQQKNISFLHDHFKNIKIKWNDPGPYSDWDIPK